MKCLWVIRSVKAFTYGSNQRRVQLFHTLTSFHIGCELVQRIHSNGSCVTDKLCVQRPSAAAVLLLLARACVWEMSLNQDFRIKLGLIVIFLFFIQKLLNFEANLTVWAVWALRQQSCQKRKEKKEEGWRTGTTAMWRGTTLLGKNSSIPCRVQSALSRHAEAGAVLPELPPVVRDEDEEEEEESRATCRFRLHTWKQWLWFLLR